MSDQGLPAPRRRLSPFMLLPLLFFVGLAALFLFQLVSGRDAASLPSALIGAPAPATVLPPLEGTGLPGIDPAEFKGRVTVLNVWASWCAPCREEHPLLVELSRDTRFALVGLNYKDKPDNAAGFLRELGNPYQAIGIDATGRAAIDWGVYGVPETFVVGRDGTIRFKHVGPLDPTSLRERLLPAIDKALSEPAPPS